MKIEKIETMPGIDLQGSFVLGWEKKGKELIFDVEFSIWPGSVHYESPQPNEYTCYKRGCLVFSEVRWLDGLKSPEETPSTKDPDGSIDFGNIDALFEEDDQVRLEGDFGKVVVDCDRVAVQIGT